MLDADGARALLAGEGATPAGTEGEERVPARSLREDAYARLALFLAESCGAHEVRDVLGLPARVEVVQEGLREPDQLPQRLHLVPGHPLHDTTDYQIHCDVAKTLQNTIREMH